MQLLCLVQNFRQGWGGAPESIRLFAQVLAEAGFSVDVCDLGRLHRAVERLECLPEVGAESEPFEFEQVPAYRAILVVGPWQDPRLLRRILVARRETQPLIYLPRGGLAQIEFSRLRDLKKWPYFYLFERRIIAQSTAVVYSSDKERSHTIAGAMRHPRAVVIPDFFRASWSFQNHPAAADHETRIAFMAEISPRKGLLPMVDGFLRYAASSDPSRRIRLTIGGLARKGSHSYFAKSKAAALRAPKHATIEFIGPVHHSERSAFYGQADIFAVPSLFESFGLTVLEGLAEGCAEIIGPDVGVLQFLPKHQRIAILPQVTPEHIADAIMRQHRLLLTKDRRERAATAAFAAEAIQAINQEATKRWLQLLSDGTLSGSVC